MAKQLFILSACFIVAAGLGARAMRPELVPLRESLNTFPTSIDRWTGRDAPKFTDDMMAVLGVDEYVNRVYFAPEEPYTLALHRLLPEPARGRHHPFAAQLSAGRRLDPRW